MKSWNEKIYFLRIYKKLLSLQLEYLRQKDEEERTINLQDIQDMLLDATISEKIDF